MNFFTLFWNNMTSYIKNHICINIIKLKEGNDNYEGHGDNSTNNNDKGDGGSLDSCS